MEKYLHSLGQKLKSTTVSAIILPSHGQKITIEDIVTNTEGQRTQVVGKSHLVGFFLMQQGINPLPTQRPRPQRMFYQQVASNKACAGCASR